MKRYRITIDGFIAGYTFYKPEVHKSWQDFEIWVRNKYDFFIKENSVIEYLYEP